MFTIINTLTSICIVNLSASYSRRARNPIMGISFVVHAIRGERFLTVGASCVQDDSSDKPAKKSAARTGTQRGRPVFLREERHSRVALFPYIADVNRTSRGLWCVYYTDQMCTQRQLPLTWTAVTQFAKPKLFATLWKRIALSETTIMYECYSNMSSGVAFAYPRRNDNGTCLTMRSGA